MAIDYINKLEHIEDQCDQFDRFMRHIFAETKHKWWYTYNLRNLVNSPSYRQLFDPIKESVDLCKIIKVKFPEHGEKMFYESAIELESSEELKTYEKFQEPLQKLKVCFSVIKEQIQAFCSSFDDVERERMNEAIHNFIHRCNYSCVAMSVSAVESRLLQLMVMANSGSTAKLEELTLGNLVNEYIRNKEKYKNIVPEEHETLLGLCNTYRIFSVHPKKQKLTDHKTNAVFSLTIVFLTDPNTRPEVIKAKLYT